MRVSSFSLAVAAFALGAFAGPQSAHAAYTLVNTTGGNGYVKDIVTSSSGYTTGYTVVGSDDCGAHLYNYTTYTDIASHDMSLTFSYSYVTHDVGDLGNNGSSWYDPAGYVINGVYSQLSQNDWNVYDTGVVYSGVVTLNVLAGQSYGFYVYSYDGVYGAAEITVSYVPLPAALPLFGSALLGMGAFARKRRA